QRQLEEQRFVRLPVLHLHLPADGLVVVMTVFDGVIEDSGVRREPCHRELLDIPAKRTAHQQTAGDIVEPEALTHLMELLSRLHQDTSLGRGWCEPPPGADRIRDSTGRLAPAGGVRCWPARQSTR